MFNGYHNYETWACSVWLTNDESLYTKAMSLKEVSKDKEEFARNIMEWFIKMYDKESQLKNRYLIAGIGNIAEVDFYEVVENFY